MFSVSRKILLRIESATVLGAGSLIKYQISRAFRLPQVALSLRDIGTVTVRPQDSDYATFVQVFVERQYDLPPAHAERINARYMQLLTENRIPVIVDAGANVGAASIWFGHQFPRATIVAIEPDTSNFALCKSNVDHQNIIVVHGALAGAPGWVTIERSGQSWGIQTRRSDAGLAAYTIPDLLGFAGDNASLFIVKIDVEGFESDVFAHDNGWIRDTDAIYVEPRDWMLPGQKTSASFQRAIAPHGFELLIAGENIAFVR